MSDTSTQVKAATIELEPDDGPAHNWRYRLTLRTDDGEVTFTLDTLAAVLLSLALGPAMKEHDRAMKARAE